MSKVFRCLYGSHLYGLNTAASDHDYKEIYLPALRDVMFGSRATVTDNHTDEVDNTVMPVTAFVRNLAKADIVSIDMLHAPAQFTLVSSPLWEEIRRYRQDVYSKNMRGIIGYIKTQTAKYGNKIDRFDELTRFIDYLKSLGRKDIKIQDSEVVQHVIDSGYKHIVYRAYRHPGAINAIDVLGKSHQVNNYIDYVLGELERTLAGYGNRVKQSSDTSGDWKAYSHSYRALVQLEEIIDTRDLVFPLARASEILPMKLGEMSRLDASQLIDDTYDRVISKLESSDLPDQADMSRIEAAVLNSYFTK